MWWTVSKEAWRMPADMSLGRWKPGICWFWGTSLEALRFTNRSMKIIKTWRWTSELHNGDFPIINSWLHSTFQMHACTAAEQLHIEWMCMVRCDWTFLVLFPRIVFQKHLVYTDVHIVLLSHSYLYSWIFCIREYDMCDFILMYVYIYIYNIYIYNI